MKVIAIIGFGFCGRLAFYHLAKTKREKTKILIFEKNTKDYLGSAFSAFSPHYILNVPAEKMSAFSNDPKSFCRFLERNYPDVFAEIGEDGFASRQIYGKYLEEITTEAFLNAQKNGLEVEFISEEVTEISKDFLINSSYQANEILLATSFKQSDLPVNENKISAQKLVKNLWNLEAKTFHDKRFTGDEKICLIGSGLTAVDLIVGLKKKDFKGKIFVVSRRGNFPKKHFKEVSKIELNLYIEAGEKLLSILLKIRVFLRQNPQYDLRHVIDFLRPQTTKIWHGFNEKEKRKFLRFLPYWNIFRHRAPAASIELIEEMIAKNSLEIIKKSAANLDENFVSDYFVNCLGFEMCVEKYPLLAQMMNAGLLKKDVLLLQSNHEKIFLLGGLNIGKDFECTSVPDLRKGVEELLI